MRKFLLSSLAFVSLSLCAQTTFKSGVFTYKVTSPTTVELNDADDKDGSGNAITTYDIPQTVENEGVAYTVTSIGYEAFRWSKMLSVTLPETIDSLKQGAFSGTSKLTSITLPSKLKYIGNIAFSSSGLTSIVIPDAVEEIDNSAFFTAKQLTSIQFGKGLKKIGNSAFYKCALTAVTLPEAVDSIANGMFYGCSQLKSVKLSSKTRILGKRAFRECPALTQIDIPSGVKVVDDECFLLCTGMTSLNLPAAVAQLGNGIIASSGISTITIDPANENFKSVDGIIYNTDGTVLYVAPSKGLVEYSVPKGCIGISGGAFWGSEIKKITLPDGFLAVDDNAFCQTPLEQVNFPKSLVYIGIQGFAGTQMTEVTLPENMPTLYDEAFADSPNLTSLTIPSGVKLIGPMAFRKCKNLKTVTCLGSEAPELYYYEYYENPFYDIAEDATAYVPKGSSYSYSSAGFSDYLKIEETDKGVFKPTNTNPKDESTMEAGWKDMKFDVTFDEPVTIINSNPDAFLRVGSMTAGQIIEPYGQWNATKGDDANTVRVWADDGDRYMQSFKVENGKEYYIVIPAGTVKNAAGEENEQIVITVKCEETNGINGAEGKADAKEVARYNMGGQKIKTAQPGINIVKMSDGTVRKILVK